MAFTTISTTNCLKGEKTVIQSGSTGGFLFQVRFPAVGTALLQPFADIINFWDTGDANVGRVTRQIVNVLGDRTEIVTTAVPEGTQGLQIYVREKAPDDSYQVILYRRL